MRLLGSPKQQTRHLSKLKVGPSSALSPALIHCRPENHQHKGPQETVNNPETRKFLSALHCGERRDSSYCQQGQTETEAAPKSSNCEQVHERGQECYDDHKELAPIYRQDDIDGSNGIRHASRSPAQ
jgi:hypothetical protein